VTGCGICKNLRFAGAQQAGLGEDDVALIGDGYPCSDLSPRWKLAARRADALITAPTPTVAGEVAPPRA
jgi:hypothetical protein